MSASGVEPRLRGGGFDQPSLGAGAPPAKRLPAPGSIGAWILACRPATLTAGAVPVLVGAAISHASGAFQPRAFAAALVGAVCLQIGSNLANDAYDFEAGVDDEKRVGPARAAQSGLLSTRALKRGMWLAFAIATAMGMYLTLVAGLAIVAIGLTSIVAAIAYTAGPYPLGYHGFGDLFVFLFFGLVAVPGTVLCVHGSVPWIAWVVACDVGAIATAILVVNNVRDHVGDARNRKRTLVVRWGRSFGVAEYAILVGLAHTAPIVVTIALRTPFPLAALVTAPWAFVLARRVFRHHDGPTLNGCLAATAKLLLAHGLLLAAGIALGAG